MPAPTDNAPTEDPEPKIAGRSTIGHVRNAKDDPAAPSWNNLTEKVKAFVGQRFRNAHLPRLYTVDDLQCDTLYRVLRSLSQFELRKGDTFWGWVWRLAENSRKDAWKHCRSDKRDVSREVSSGSESVWERPGRNSPPLEAQIREHWNAMQDCIRSMNDDIATVLELRLLQHTSYATILQRMDRKNEASLRLLFHRGQNKLDACMAAKGFARPADA